MGLGDGAERRDARSTWSAGRRGIELQSSKRGGWQSLLTILFWLGICGGIVAAIVMVAKRGDKNERLAAVEGLAARPTEPYEPTITMTQVSAGVYHLDFGGDLCDDAQCLKRASGLVLERAPDSRIVSIAPIGAYGSPSALAIVTVPIY